MVQIGPGILFPHEITTYLLHLPPLDSAESLWHVGDIGLIAAELVGPDEWQQMELFYRDRNLHDDHRSCREETLERSGEVICVTAEEFHSDDDDDDDDDDELLDEFDLYE